jgi:hypothetical protein
MSTREWITHRGAPSYSCTDPACTTADVTLFKTEVPCQRGKCTPVAETGNAQVVKIQGERGELGLKINGSLCMASKGSNLPWTMGDVRVVGPDSVRHALKNESYDSFATDGESCWATKEPRCPTKNDVVSEWFPTQQLDSCDCPSGSKPSASHTPTSGTYQGVPVSRCIWTGVEGPQSKTKKSCLAAGPLDGDYDFVSTPIPWWCRCPEPLKFEWDGNGRAYCVKPWTE